VSARGTRTPRRTVDPARRTGLLLVGAAAVALAVAAVLVAFRAERGIPGQSFLTVHAQVQELGTLGSGDEVRIAGRLVGRTARTRLVDGVPTVTLELRDIARPLPADSAVRVRPKGLLGTQYVDLVPGRSPRTLASGETIGRARTSTAVPLADVLDGLDAPTRDGLGATLRGLGGGLAGRGDGLDDALGVAPGMLRALSRSLRPLLDREGTTARFVRGLRAFAVAAEPVADDIAGGFGDGEAAMRPFAQEAESLAETFAVAPGALAGTRTALRRTSPLLARTTRFARAATRFSAVAPAGLGAVTEVLVDGRGPLDDLDALLRTTRRAVAPTVALAAAVDPVLPRLEATLALTREPARTLGRFGCDIRGFGANWRSFLGYAPQGQTGRLGPQTLLRTSTGAPSGQTPNVGPGLLAGSGVDVDPAPCRPAGGGRR
jgi:phospholipid/cholesterol/gamma-HCH transport system substrate-binding protein